MTDWFDRFVTIVWSIAYIYAIVFTDLTLFEILVLIALAMIVWEIRQ